MLTSETKVQNLIHELGISQPKIVDITKEQRKSITNHFKFLLILFIQVITTVFVN